MKVIENKKNRAIPYLCIIVVILFIVSVGMYIKLRNDSMGCDDKDLNHLNPQIVCLGKQIVNKKSYVEFKIKLNLYIDREKTEGNISEAAIYFRDLQYGPTFGIDEYAKFSPASLLKLPMMISYLDLSESDPKILDNEIYFEGYNQDIKQSILPKISAKEGVHYKILELINMMIKYSDNDSYYALLAYLNTLAPNTQLLRDTFVDLGIIDPKSTFEETITVKSYAGIFTQLFNSTFFSSKVTSEIALSMLTDTDFTEGVVAGVPRGTRVAHKFGERFDDVAKVKQLHDCGIVYYPQNPYLLCVMTKGDDIDKLKLFISEVSRMTYQEFDSRRI
jgi:beta-lactamase class A